MISKRLALKITSLDKETRKIFESGYYNIPRFQRPYSWEKEQIYDFWEDVINSAHSDYFIGSIVVYKKTPDLFGIVDGQQRLTTITMILCALRDFYLDEGFENLARGVLLLIERIDLNKNRRDILNFFSLTSFYSQNIRTINNKIKNIKISIKQNQILILIEM